MEGGTERDGGPLCTRVNPHEECDPYCKRGLMNKNVFKRHYLSWDLLQQAEVLLSHPATELPTELGSS